MCPAAMPKRTMTVSMLATLAVLSSVVSHRITAFSETPPYPVFPKDFVGTINISDPTAPPSTSTVTWEMAVQAGDVGRRQIHQTIRYKNYTYSYLIFDSAPNSRPESRSANNTVIIAEDGNFPPSFFDDATPPGKCAYGTYIPPWMVLPVGFGDVIGYGGYKCDLQGGACVPPGLQYNGVVTLSDGRRAHQWNKTEQQLFLAHYYFFTDVNTNQPVFAHMWMYSSPHAYPVSFNTQCSFDIRPGNPPESSFAIRQGDKWTVNCGDRDLGPPGSGFYIRPDRIFAANSTTDDCFHFLIGDKPWQEDTRVSLYLTDFAYHTENCTSERPCVHIQPESLTFTPDDWSPQLVCLSFISQGVSSFGFSIVGGGYNYTTSSSHGMTVYTCEHGQTGLDGCNM